MTDEKKMELLEEVFEADAGTLDPGMELDNLENWDSMTALSLIVMIDEECGKRISGNDIKSMHLIQDIMDVMG